MALLAQNATAPPRSTRTSSKAPDTFDGTDASKFSTFMSQIYLHIAERPQDFPTDDDKIFYVRSYLRGIAQKWFEPNIYGGVAAIPHWDGNWALFVQELATNFGPHDPIGDARTALETMTMKPGDRIATYQLEFDNVAVMTGYNEAALHRAYYQGLPNRIKDLIANVGRPETLPGLKAIVQRFDQRYHQRLAEKAAERAANPPPSGKSSGDASASPPASGSGGGKGKGKGKGKGNSNPSSKSNPPASNTPAANGNAGQASGSNTKTAKPYADKLTATGKLKPEERERRIKFNLCMFCGGSGHKTHECKKRPGNAQGKAGSVTTPPAASADAPSTESKK